MKKRMKTGAILTAAFAAFCGILAATWILTGKVMRLLAEKEAEKTAEGIESISLSEDGFYEIRSAQDYWIFWEEAGYEDNQIKGRLMCDIRLNDTSGWPEKEFSGHCTAAILNFTGVFDGNGHTIYGLYGENGYGLVRTNKGIIRNLTIKDAVVCGGMYGGGICYSNSSEALISNCKFYGEIANRRDIYQMPDELAGICVVNSGTVRRCGFMGEFKLYNRIAKTDCESAGICVHNYNIVEDCYNLSFSPLGGNYAGSYAIADQGERNCYMIRGSGFRLSENGQVTELSVEQRLKLREYLDRDILALWRSEEPAYEKESLVGAEENKLRREALQDETVRNMVFLMLSQEKGEIGEFDFHASKEEGAEFVLTIAYKGKELLISKYVDAETDDMEKLWSRESEILGQRDADSFQHTTYFLLQREAPSEKEEIITSYQTKTDEGFFYVTEGSIYRIAPGEQETEQDQKEMFSMVETELCDQKIKSTGIVWKDDTVKEAVYEKLGVNQYALLSREDICNLKELEIENGEEIKTLADLANLKRLTSLSIMGRGEVSAIREMKNYTFDELTELVLYNCGITDISFVGNYKKLTSLSLGENNISDISPLRGLTQMERLALFNNQIDDIDALRDMKKLTVLNLSYNEVSDLSPLNGKTNLVMLGLSFNNITDISALKGMTNMVNISIGSNYVKDISAFEGMAKLQWLGLEGNEIEDYSVLAGMEGLFYLDVMGNPSQDIGDRYFTPYLLMGYHSSEEELAEAQKLLNKIPSEQGIEAYDIAYGDLNRDGISDVAIMGYYGEERDEEGNLVKWGTTSVYLFMGTGAEYQYMAAVELEDTNQEICISGNHLIVQSYYNRSTITDIYEYKNGNILPIFSLSMHESWFSSGYDWYVYDYVQDAEKRYAAVGEWDQPVELFLLWDDAETVDEKYAKIAKQFEDAWKLLEQKGAESGGQTFPELNYWDYVADIDGGGYSEYEIHRQILEVERTPEEVLDAAVEEFFLPDTAICFPIKEYASEEIKNNYDLLAGVELPSVFYVGRDRSGEWRTLSYMSCSQTENGSIVHALRFEEPSEEYQMWFGTESILHYNEMSREFE